MIRIGAVLHRLVPDFIMLPLVASRQKSKYAFVEMDIDVALQKKKKGVQFLARSIVEGIYLFKIEEAG